MTNLREHLQIPMPHNADPVLHKLIDDINQALGVICWRLFRLPGDGIVDDGLSLLSTDNQNGTITLSQRVAYEDINIGSLSLGTGASAPDPIAYGAGGTIYVRGFDGVNTTEQLFAELEIPHAFKANTYIIPHLHWCPTTAAAGNVKWQITYNINTDDTAPVASASDSVIVAASGVAWQWKRSDFSPILVPNIGRQLLVRLFRNPSDGDDSYGDDAAVATFGFHLQKDSLGSEQVTVK